MHIHNIVIVRSRVPSRRFPVEGLCSNKLFAVASEFLVTPLLMGLVCLISQGGFEEPDRPCVHRHRKPL